MNQDISTLCPTFDVNTPILNPIDLSSYPSSNYNWWMKLLVALFSILLRPYSYIQIPSLSNTHSHTIRLSFSLNVTISHPYNRLYHNSVYFIFSKANKKIFQRKWYQSWYDTSSKEEYMHHSNTKRKGRYYLLKWDVYLSNKYTSMNSA